MLQIGFPVAFSLLRIHFLNWTIQSYSFSQVNLSLVLYLSCDPEVECPWGWVISSTCTKDGLWYSLEKLTASW